MTTISKSTATPLRLLAIAALMAILSSIAQAADWPSFKAGNWTFERTMSGMDGMPNKVSRTECTDPASDQASQRAMLESPVASSHRSRRAAAPIATRQPARWQV